MAQILGRQFCSAGSVAIIQPFAKTIAVAAAIAGLCRIDRFLTASDVRSASSEQLALVDLEKHCLVVVAAG